MKTREEIEQWLNENLPDGPENDREEGMQDALNWVLGITREL